MLGAVTTFARPAHLLVDVPLVALVFMENGLPCTALSAGCGELLSRSSSDPRTLRLFNFGMAALLIALIGPGLARAREHFLRSKWTGYIYIICVIGIVRITVHIERYGVV